MFGLAGLRRAMPLSNAVSRVVGDTGWRACRTPPQGLCCHLELRREQFFFDVVDLNTFPVLLELKPFFLDYPWSILGNFVKQESKQGVLLPFLTTCK